MFCYVHRDREKERDTGWGAVRSEKVRSFLFFPEAFGGDSPSLGSLTIFQIHICTRMSNFKIVQIRMNNNEHIDDR